MNIQRWEISPYIWEVETEVEIDESEDKHEHLILKFLLGNGT